MYGPISGNIPGLSVADSAIVFEFLAKVIKFIVAASACSQGTFFSLVAIFIHRASLCSCPGLIPFLFFPADLDHTSKRCYDYSKTCKIGDFWNI